MSYLNEPSSWIALWGASLSTILAVIKINETIRQKGKIKIMADLVDGNLYNDGKFKLSILVVKKGKEPIFLSGLSYYSQKGIAGSISFGKEPIKLVDEGETKLFSTIEPSLVGMDSIHIYDTLGRKYQINRKDLDKMKEKYLQMINPN